MATENRSFTGSEPYPAAARPGLTPRALAAHAATGVLLLEPTVLAFFTGGYFDTPRLWAGLVAWALVGLAAVLGPWPLTAGRAGRLALGGLALLAVWTLLSMAWAPIPVTAYAAGERDVLYLGALLAAAMLLRTPAAQRAVVPALAGGALIVVGYGLAGRFVPGLLHYARSVSAQGRLEQPLTYWNAMGELAAIGLVLAVALAAEQTRPRSLRAAAAGACAPLGMGLYLTFSRGALFAFAAGLLCLIVTAARWSTVRAAAGGVVCAAVAAAAAAPFGGVTNLSGSLSTRERQGAIALGLLVAITAAAVLVHLVLARGSDTRPLPLPRRAPLIATGLVCAGLALVIVVGAREPSGRRLAPGASRLVTLQSDRYDYWRVALHDFGQQPLRGVGAGGWAVSWLRRRPYAVGAQDAHSLPIQTLGELGVLGLALLLASLAGVLLAARAALRAAPVLGAAATAGAVTYIAHAPLDWDWEMPALTLVAVVLAGLLLALAGQRQVVEA